MRTKMMIMAAALALCLASTTWAAGKTYQVTGPIIELTDTKIVVDKNGEMHEIARQLSATLETKIALLDRLVREADRAAGRPAIRKRP